MNIISKIKLYLAKKRALKNKRIPSSYSFNIVYGYVRERLAEESPCHELPMASRKLERRYSFESEDAVSVVLGYIEKLEKEKGKWQVH